ncbi:type VI secretion system tube protein Hcp [Pendulispora rubella]|uniref:Type VI secretion system tube protein Hcp n=1 Tax=Pendulispora rubella TaxID=2741070 RepID=A0ABZ2LC01_9BACT
MTATEQSLIYLEIKGSKQGEFKTDDAQARAGKTVCLAFGHGIDVPHDTQGKGRAVVRNKPVWVICEWNPLVVQCQQAAWDNEELKEVVIKRARRDSNGNEVVYATTTLTKATVAKFRTLSGPTSKWLPGNHPDLARISFLASKIDVTLHSPDGDTRAHYDRKENKS